MSDQWEIPPGMATGLLPRESRYGLLRGCDKLEDRFDVIDPREWPEIIRERPIDLRQHVRHIFSQGNIGSCAAEQTCAGKALTDVASGKQFTLYNPWSLYYKTSGGRDGGSTLDGNLQLAREQGILPATAWPRERGWSTRPPQSLLDDVASKHRIDEFFDIGSYAEFGTALLLGFCVGYGRRGHAILATRLVSPDEIEYANSWHASWGDEGFGRDRMSGINFGYGAFAHRTTVSHGGGEQPPEPE